MIKHPKASGMIALIERIILTTIIYEFFIL